ncbi:hypothetical protein GUITHDRAFT_138914 [Guillardia theta CCMP2712]|uniref:Uncharacterized protein n=1 Tax=Guillardia theta (strain CCMP2712) TaxID=905079 RepID=L1JCA6_GUITC|nr:hypothetical protein GUITHDRAFT_138914 [Guillardia theta CCMP2712]EKX45720.1 hypothetical protein GUITHDRAFT_138914 [Guillardia theta CCMP2712]|eukprot:XP_005832700.1 hypothetical protein GUITHDRAFT_138914 [Guillardia theta CCMP2712]
MSKSDRHAVPCDEPEGKSEGGAEQSRAEQSRAEQSRAEQSRAEQSRAEQSRAEQSRAEQSRAEQSRAEQSRAEQSRAEQSRAEQSRAEQSGNDSVDVEKDESSGDSGLTHFDRGRQLLKVDSLRTSLMKTFGAELKADGRKGTSQAGGQGEAKGKKQGAADEAAMQGMENNDTESESEAEAGEVQGSSSQVPSTSNEGGERQQGGLVAKITRVIKVTPSQVFVMGPEKASKGAGLKLLGCGADVKAVAVAELSESTLESSRETSINPQRWDTKSDGTLRYAVNLRQVPRSLASLSPPFKVEVCGTDWMRVSRFFQNRSPEDCRRRWKALCPPLVKSSDVSVSRAPDELSHVNVQEGKRARESPSSSRAGGDVPRSRPRPPSKSAGGAQGDKRAIERAREDLGGQIMLSLVASQLLELPLPDWIPSARTVEEEEDKEEEEEERSKRCWIPALPSQWFIH